jgi:hypothetical protein
MFEIEALERKVQGKVRVGVRVRLGLGHAACFADVLQTVKIAGY